MERFELFVRKVLLYHPLVGNNLLLYGKQLGALTESKSKWISLEKIHSWFEYAPSSRGLSVSTLLNQSQCFDLKIRIQEANAFSLLDFDKL